MTKVLYTDCCYAATVMLLLVMGTVIYGLEVTRSVV